MELKPCPFCGSHEIDISYDEEFFLAWAKCKNCGIETRGVRPTVKPYKLGVADLKESAVELWNRRATDEVKNLKTP